MPAKCGNCGGQHLATAANCPMRQRGRTPTVPTGVLRNRDGVVISHIPEVAMVVASRARERPAEKGPAEKEPAAAELITERLESSDEDSVMSEPSASVRAELAEWASMGNSTPEMPRSLGLAGPSTPEGVKLVMPDAAA